MTINENYYEFMGVSNDAPISEIKAKYRILAKQLHPDSKTGNEGDFKKLQHIYNTLIDETKRSQYNYNLSDKTPKVTINFTIADIYNGGDKRFIFPNESGESIGLHFKVYNRKIPNNTLYVYKDSSNTKRQVFTKVNIIPKLTTIDFEISITGFDIKVKVLTRNESNKIFIPELKFEFQNNKQFLLFENYGLRTDDSSGNLLIDNTINIVESEYQLV